VAGYAERGQRRVADPDAAAPHLNRLIVGAPLDEAMLLGDDAVPDDQALRRHVTEAVRIFVATHPGGRGISAGQGHVK
jgi:hypothetical protein